MKIIDQAFKSALQKAAPVAEQNGRLTPEQLDIIYHEKWFSLFVPEAYGGLELSLPEGLQTEEALAQIDGSLGWTVTLCSGASLFVGYLQPHLVQSLFHDPKICFGGSGAATGTAAINSEGYVVSGFWKYATGAPYNTVFTANCRLEKDGKPVYADGKPVIQPFLFLKDEVTLHPEWNTMGLKATASYSFEVNHLQVNKHRSFIISGEHAVLPQPVYQYPFLQLAEATIAVNTLGMVQHFLDECERLFTAGNHLHNKRDILLHEAKETLANLRTQFYNAVTASWHELLSKKIISEAVLQKVSRASRLLAGNGRLLAVNLYPHCGISGADPTTTINRIWRDLFTASQHNLLL